MTRLQRYNPKFHIDHEALFLELEVLSMPTRPAPNLVVSKNRDGSAASFYSDPIWNYDAYMGDGTNGKFNFIFWCEPIINRDHESLIEEIKWLDFCNMWMRDGPTIALPTIKLLHLATCKLAKFAYSNGIGLVKLLGSEHEFSKYLHQISPAEARNLRNLLSALYKIPPEVLGFRLVTREKLTELSKITAEIAYDQTVAIPTRIYSKLLSNLAQQLDIVEEVLDRLISLIRDCSSHPMMGRCLSVQAARTKKSTGFSFDANAAQPTFGELAQRNGIEDHLAKHSVTSIRQLSSYISTIQTLCKTLIHAYTGMRDNEVETLPLMCLISEQRDGMPHHLIVGKTYKFNAGRGHRTKWVTGSDAVRAIMVVQRLTKLAIELVSPSQLSSNEPDDHYPLFVSLTYFGLGRPTPDMRNFQMERAKNLHLKDRTEWLKSLNLVITENDIQELADIDPFRDWKNTEFQIGSFWPLKTHQLRRSLALYASRSGLVALPSLRRQLQHITNEMSLYYSRGSFFAKNFIDPDDPENRRHFMFEHQESAAESEMLAILFHVVKNEADLFGGQGQFWQRQKDAGKIDILTFDRAKTAKDVKNGLRRYRETPLGGCGKISECTERAMGNVMGCLLADGSTRTRPTPCRDSYISLERLNNVIASQEERVSKERAVDPTSMFYKEASDDLEVLRGYKIRYERKISK